MERVLTHLALIVAAVICAAPFFYVIAASLKDQGSLFHYPPVWVQIPPYTGNYERLLFDSGFPRWMLNTLFVASTVTGLKLVLDSMAAYALAKLEFTGKRLIFLLMLILLMVPFAALLIPLWSIAHNLHITNTYLALILPPLANPLGVFLMRQYISGAVPNELIEAARVDGCHTLRVFWHVVLPAVRPAAAVLGLLTFMNTWNDFFWPLIVLTPHNPTVQVAVSTLAGAQYVPDYSLILTGTFISILPLLVVFLVLGKQIVGGIMKGAIKG